MKNLLVRAMTGIVLVAIIIGCTILGRPYLFGMTLFLSIIGIFEFFTVNKKLGYNPSIILGILFSIILLTIDYLGYVKVEGTALIIYTFIVMGSMTFFDKFNLETTYLQVFVIMYIPLAFSRLILLSGTEIIWLVYICSWGTDTFAYLVGSVMGKHKLSKKLSPKKSIEGAIGGVVGCIILTYIFAVFLKLDNKFVLMFVAAIGSVISQMGDLCASKFKRLSDTKDYGKIFLGHGGVLDRFDSVLFTAPYIYLVSILIY
ncbi:phosphatidate cytidylyltransferase [Miniphocaeibacter massiliensis]|uniref:phosphatidate cytidylyltransferase n=1 Tax=Miniphocaeibacter massiliensis TaxID=2041841 RepID=UPI000C088B6E|nr:phosphatidate cytidylyltransferase [Miniphocaeibacter massiliensis]